MEMLESAMAFAVAMIVFSTVVTGIVEVVVRISGFRAKNLRTTVESLFEKVIWPRMRARLVELSGEAETTAKPKCRNAFVDSMVGNPAAATALEGQATGRQKTMSFLSHDKQIDVLTPLAFAERLGRSDVGRAVLAEGEAQVNLLVNDFVRTFDRFGRASSEIFRKYTQLTAIVVGIVFALVVNVDAGRLYTTLLRNPDLRSGLVAQVDEAAKANREAAESLQKALENAATGTGLTPKDKETIKAQLEQVEDGIAALKGQGLPIGYEYFPYCGAGNKDASCQKGGQAYFLEFVSWVCLAVLAGVLIGLGGPFWFKVFSSLSQVFQVMRTLGIAREQAPDKSKEQPGAVPAAEQTVKPKSVIDAFQVAARVHAHDTPETRRALLGPDGQSL